MNRPVLVAILVYTLGSGCSTSPPMIPPGENPDTIVAAIARRGQGIDPTDQIERPDSTIAHTILSTTVKVAETGLLVGGVGCLIGLACLAKGGNGFSGSGIGSAFNDIWSQD